VTQKLLTGYDAPILSTMYLDKPMKDHTLLQAIARVNRPYPEKQGGLIIDYIGIFEDLQRALAFEDEEITKGLVNIEELRRYFAQQMAVVRDLLAPIDLRSTPGRLDRIIDHFFDETARETFIQRFKELQTAYEILSPDPFLRDYLDDYALIAQIYQTVYNAFSPEAAERRQRRLVLVKTDALIRKHVGVDGLGEMPLYPINRDIANVVRDDDVSDRVKVTNLYRSLTVYIEQHAQEQPYLMSIGERVEQVIQQLRDRQISVQSALYELSSMVESATEAEEEQAESGMDPGEYALYWVLKGQGAADPEALAGEVEEVLSAHRGWPTNDGQERTVRLQIYKLLHGRLPNGERPEVLKTSVDAMLRMRRMVGA
jgi:type I restriction enzyme, R subunit